MARREGTPMEEMLNDRLKDLIKARGLTQKELAQKCHLTEASVSKYLSGARTPHLEVLPVLAEALGTTTDYLLGRKPLTESENFQAIADAISRHKGAFTMEEKIKLISLLSQ
jgi:transcriptional regulator with XRE-family HTH domain